MQELLQWRKKPVTLTQTARARENYSNGKGVVPKTQMNENNRKSNQTLQTHRWVIIYETRE